MHARLLNLLRNMTRRVWLVARLRDDRLGFPSDKRLFVFIPDVHLVSRTRRASFNYGTNSIPMLTQLCLNLKVMKSQLAGDEELDLYQLGDLLDLWRQTTKQSDHLSAAAVISNDYPELMGALRHTSLDCQFLFGNHDLMLYGSDDYLAWNWRY